MHGALIRIRGLYARGMHLQKTSLCAFGHSIKMKLGRGSRTGSKNGIIESNHEQYEGLRNGTSHFPFDQELPFLRIPRSYPLSVRLHSASLFASPSPQNKELGIKANDKSRNSE